MIKQYYESRPLHIHISTNERVHATPTDAVGLHERIGRTTDAVL